METEAGDLASDPFFVSLIQKFSPGSLALALTGSFANGEATPFSDIDLIRLVDDATLKRVTPYRLISFKGRMVSLTQKSPGSIARELTHPATHYLVKPALQSALSLADDQQVLTQLRQQAAGIGWHDLAPSASEYIAGELCGLAEEASKVLSGLFLEQTSRTLYGVHLLCLGLPKLIYVYTKQYLRSESLYYQRCQEIAGLDSGWSRMLRRSLMLEGDLNYQQAGKAALKLYLHTIGVTGDVLSEKQWQVCKLISDQISIMTL